MKHLRKYRSFLEAIGFQISNDNRDEDTGSSRKKLGYSSSNIEIINSAKETPIESLSELKIGDEVLIDNPMRKDDLCVVMMIYDTHKYPIRSDGRKYRSLGRGEDGKLQFVYADESGDMGDEMIKEYAFQSSEEGDYNFTEDDDISEWNIRLIGLDHPRYDPELAKYGKLFSNTLNGLFGDENNL